jgi:prepilin-type N-terminal cleavage/methylation domain-containing protein
MAAAREMRGFTLVELLVALAIFGLVVGVASYGFSLFSRHWDGRSGQFGRTQGQYLRLNLVTAALEDTLPWAVRNEAGKPGFYFLGRDEGLTLVTGSPVFSPGSAAVIRLFREPDGAGRWKLVYEEAPLNGVLLREANQVLPFAHRMVVLDGLPKPVFRYFGWESLERRLAADETADPGLTPRWFEEYDGLARGQHPQRIAFALGETEAVFFVPARADAALRRTVAVE